MIKEVKRRSITIHEQKNILDMIHEGNLTYSDISDETGVNVNTIKTIKRREDKILQQFSEGRKLEKWRKKMRNVEHPDLETALVHWFCQAREEHKIITEELLQTRANLMHPELCQKSPCNFVASRGWLYCFKRRNKIRQLTVSGEKLSADGTEVQSFIETLISKIDEMDLTLDDIYNCDESGLFYKVLPGKTLVREDEKNAPGGKMQKERITFMPCVNASGTHKLPLQFIGKSKNPRCFRNKDLPEQAYYVSSKNAWQTEYLFKDWFENVFVRHVTIFCESRGVPARGLLVLDNAPPHIRIEECQRDSFVVLRLPPNCTSLVQPLDQNVMMPMKTIYRKTLLEKVLMKQGDFHENLKAIDIYEAINILVYSYDKLQNTTIIKAWKALLKTYEPYKNLYKSLGPDFESQDHVGVFVDLLQKIGTTDATPSSLSSWLTTIDGPNHQHYNEQDLVNLVLGEDYPDAVSGSEDLVVDDDDDNRQMPQNNDYVACKLNAFNELIDHFKSTNELDKVLTLANLKQYFLTTQNQIQ